MRTLYTQQIEQAAYQLYRHASVHLGQDVLDALACARASECMPAAQGALDTALENARIAGQTGLPLCQDTGLAVVFVDLGQGVHIEGGLMTNAIQSGIARATREGCLRASVRDPITGQNTRTNTPVPIHIRLVEGESLRMVVAPKGAGSENKGRLAMLEPAAGLAGVRKFAVETVRLAGGSPCPPIVVGLGIGGNMETCALLAKRALLRTLGTPNPDGALDELEKAVLKEINALGIGAQGLGGMTTALAVHALSAPTHIACLPVAVAIQCHVSRHAEVTL
nr:fumarate hydratase [bacterium]